MSTPSPAARRIRRITCGAALVLFPALLVIEGPLDPATGGSGDVYWKAATEHAGALFASGLLLMVSGILMAPAIAGLVHAARDRGSSLTNTGAVLGVLGGAGHIGLGTMYLLMLSLKGGDRSQMVAFVDRLGSSSALGVFFPLLIFFGLGLVFLAWGAWRAGVIGIWGPVVTTVVVVAHTVLPGDMPVVEAAALFALLVAFGYLGVRTVRMTDGEWDGTRATAAEPARVSA
jgi:hypothetical protein